MPNRPPRATVAIPLLATLIACGGVEASDSGSRDGDAHVGFDGGDGSVVNPGDASDSSDASEGMGDGAISRPDAAPTPPTLCADQCVYIRAAAGGSASGEDWTNALPSLPASLERGNVYLIGPGTYPSYRFDAPPRGTEQITIKRATAADHGSDVGWLAAYGEGQAVWNGPLHFDTDGWIFDGSVRDESDWFAGAEYGFRIFHDNHGEQVRMGSLGEAVSNVELRHTHLQALDTPMSETEGESRLGLDISTYGGSGTSTGLIVHRCFFQYGNVPIFTHSNDGMVVEYSAFDDNQSTAANHGEAMSAFYTNHRFVIRYNMFRAIHGTAVIAFTTGSGEPVDGFEIYGNVVWDSNVGDGVFGFANEEWPFSNTRIYNNTIVDKVGGYNNGIAILSGTNNVVHNNLWVNCEESFWNGGGATYSHNAYSWTPSEPDAETGLSTAIFADYAGDDFSLASPTAPGSPLGAPYDADLRGRARSDDGSWDRGAYEYNP